MWLTFQGLRLRRCKQDLFLRGEYLPLAASGVAAGNVVAFARKYEADLAIAVAPRLIANLTGFEQGFPMGEIWRDTQLNLNGLRGQRLENVYTGQKFRVGAEDRLLLSELFDKFPAALLVPSSGLRMPSSTNCTCAHSSIAITTASATFKGSLNGSTICKTSV
jgi:(1->4)-alpha-D-glucan 1-alpha-D-glucosylmutase